MKNLMAIVVLLLTAQVFAQVEMELVKEIEVKYPETDPEYICRDDISAFEIYNVSKPSEITVIEGKEDEFGIAVPEVSSNIKVNDNTISFTSTKNNFGLLPGRSYDFVLDLDSDSLELYSPKSDKTYYMDCERL